MKTVIFGSRKVAPYEDAPKDSHRLITPDEVKWMVAVLDNFHLKFDRITEIVTGMAQGVDCVGFAWGSIMDIPIKSFRPNWEKHGKKAGILRNTEMALYADRGICFYDGYSRGTRHMLGEMKRLKKPVYLYMLHYDGKLGNLDYPPSAI